MSGLIITAVLLGIRHALDADHLAAVSTLVAEERRPGPALRLGGLWGIGHLLPIALLGVVAVGAKTQIPGTFAEAMELGVGLVLIALGLWTLWRLGLEWVRGSRHHHGGARGHGGYRRGVLSFVTGMCHGLAGSAAVAVLAAAASTSLWGALGFLLAFGIGTAVGMMAVTLAVIMPTLLTAHRQIRIQWAVRGLAGVSSTVVGVLMCREVWPALWP